MANGRELVNGASGVSPLCSVVEVNAHSLDQPISLFMRGKKDDGKTASGCGLCSQRTNRSSCTTRYTYRSLAFARLWPFFR